MTAESRRDGGAGGYPRQRRPRMIDAGGAAMRRRDEFEADAEMFRTRLPKTPAPAPRHPVQTPSSAKVTVHVTETHDGEACDCIEKDMTLGVGDEVELTHVCHDGRVDKVVARVTAISPAIEHGSAEVR